MSLMPTSFPTQNAHRLLVWHPDSANDDHARLATLAANGLSAARGALSLAPWLPTPMRDALAEPLAALADHVARRNPVSAMFIATIESITNRIDAESDALSGDRDEVTERRVNHFVSLLYDAGAAANRVLDHLGAEAAIQAAREACGAAGRDGGGDHDA